jgi:hypothetical protein
MAFAAVPAFSGIGGEIAIALALANFRSDFRLSAQAKGAGNTNLKIL